MKRIRYTKYTGDPASEMSMEDMLKALSEYLLDSGFQDPWSRFAELDGEHTMDNLREALRQALETGDLFDGEMQQRIEQMMRMASSTSSSKKSSNAWSRRTTSPVRDGRTQIRNRRGARLAWPRAGCALR